MNIKNKILIYYKYIDNIIHLLYTMLNLKHKWSLNHESI